MKLYEHHFLNELKNLTTNFLKMIVFYVIKLNLVII